MRQGGYGRSSEGGDSHARGGAEAHDRHCRSGSDKRIEEVREEEEVVSLEELARVASLALHAAAQHKEQGNRHSLILRICVIILLTTIYVSSSHHYICVLILLYTFPHVSSYYYMCPHTAIYVVYFSLYVSTCVLILLYVSSYYYICSIFLINIYV